MTPLKRPLLVLALLAAVLVPGVLFAEAGNAGVPVEPLWFSKDPFFVGDDVVIYAPLYNSSPYRFRGNVSLYDNGKIIGVEDFLLSPDGGSAIAAFPWKATGGEHAFSLAVIDGTFFTDNKNFIDLPISGKTATEIRRFVENKPAAPSNGESSVENGAEPIKYLSMDIPKAIISDAVPILGGIERFRIDQAERAIRGVDAIQSTIVSGYTATSTPSTATSTEAVGPWGTFGEGLADGDFLRTPWEYVKLFFVLIYEFFTTNVYAFYILLCFVAYKVVRGIFALFF
ncbi:MAG: hypothetical protein A3C93_04955 [Candidatus Lloydbacteria bacterium RIFCSPHIGHO2_02_FULL_54_17]|uniref:Uncharacterized protein n=1 Tax=Candidatus Lloydbacteria bacterium RIFCSPHIGHO2_02_FULL_54_17 TaxID=1798664 RepID=A0A1G2DEB5_9BACT|nr:MAG: hypothetical protein A2762_05740 [Candidatus Lloydbacteria bacterium RIFCSPHIGHO2_01_FULL_54_11]OGZ11118.1 MAG: hypothetical protein A3C93_04955 [Candidatus Lloydbacteria bacterium RIFCSPHIGHO2_02_FULL_54_17]OGZ14510.1 MAG: hypothetical protein A2948_05140 [Candidatus Lloydbacteria bacterium RIFCSPLOWO2_01_FULL_54_18]OGZ16942.1 MAG: hypothetical protein A3H76_03370 [Candidatus Lloydbacteria bacterium RIFCSPLOWO2_02_FULL_54_12]